MNITGKKFKLCVGVLAIIASIIMIISNVIYKTNYSYVAVLIGVLCGITLILSNSKK